MKSITVCVGTDDHKNIRVRLSLVADEGMPPVFHSVGITPGMSAALVRQAIEADISRPYSDSGIPGAPWPKIPEEEWAEVEAIVGILHTPERVAKRRSDDIKNETTINVARK